MRSYQIIRALMVCGAVFLSACATEFYTRAVDPDADAGTPVNGVPFRLRQPHIVKVFQKTEHGYVAVYETLETLPNQEQLYVLRLARGFLSDAEIDIRLSQDGTLSKVITKEVQSKGDEALSALGNAIRAIEEAKTAKREAIEGAEAAKKEVLEGELDDQTKALGLKLEADRAEAAFNALGDDTAEHTRREKRDELLLAKFAANVAYRKLGYLSPFPEVEFP